MNIMRARMKSQSLKIKSTTMSKVLKTKMLKTRLNITRARMKLQNLKIKSTTMLKIRLSTTMLKIRLNIMRARMKLQNLKIKSTSISKVLKTKMLKIRLKLDMVGSSSCHWRRGRGKEFYRVCQVTRNSS